ncbi:MAG: glutathione S-transferase [Acidithiobacillus sp.]|uniref:glutathione S-transferase n=1 Tax=Acidithiobacillus sp. TaxID=1872118 RepID=UPI003D00BA8C
MSEAVLYFRYADSAGLRLRLLSAWRGLTLRLEPRPLRDLTTAFDLGFADLPVLVDANDRCWTGDVESLPELDARLSTAPPPPALGAEWPAFVAWRAELEPLRQRLLAPILPLYPEISADPEDFDWYRQECERRFGQGPEALANDRYGAYQQLERLGRLRQLSRILAQRKFYLGDASLIDIVLTADFHALRFLDGVTVPIDLLYYFQRVASLCGLSLDSGLEADRYTHQAT